MFVLVARALYVNGVVRTTFTPIIIAWFILTSWLTLPVVPTKIATVWYIDVLRLWRWTEIILSVISKTLLVANSVNTAQQARILNILWMLLIITGIMTKMMKMKMKMMMKMMMMTMMMMTMMKMAKMMGEKVGFLILSITTSFCNRLQ